MPSAQESLDYVLTVLKHTELPQPDYHAVATETGSSNANVAQKRFKSIIEVAGFLFVNKQIVGKDGTRPEPGSRGGSVKPPRKAVPKKKRTATLKAKSASMQHANKRRKMEENSESNGAEEVGSLAGTDDETEAGTAVKVEVDEDGNGFSERAKSATAEASIEIDDNGE